MPYNFLEIITKHYSALNRRNAHLKAKLSDNLETVRGHMTYVNVIHWWDNIAKPSQQ